MHDGLPGGPQGAGFLADGEGTHRVPSPHIDKIEVTSPVVLEGRPVGSALRAL